MGCIPRTTRDLADLFLVNGLNVPCLVSGSLVQWRFSGCKVIKWRTSSVGMSNVLAPYSIQWVLGAAVIATPVGAMAHPPFVAAYPDSNKDYVCGRESQSAGGCFTHWCMSYDMKTGPSKPSEEEQRILEKYGASHSSWSPCYVLKGENGSADVSQGGVGWWGWETGKLGAPVLEGFWVRDYRRDGEREACGVNCTRYGFAARIKENPDCYHVRENWKSASADDLPADSRKPSDGWLDRAYCMRLMVAD